MLHYSHNNKTHDMENGKGCSSWVLQPVFRLLHTKKTLKNLIKPKTLHKKPRLFHPRQVCDTLPVNTANKQLA